MHVNASGLIRSGSGRNSARPDGVSGELARTNEYTSDNAILESRT